VRKDGKGPSLTVWLAVALAAVGIGVILAFLAGYFLGHATRHTNTTTVSTVSAPAEAGGGEAEGEGASASGAFEAAPAFTSDELDAEAAKTGSPTAAASPTTAFPRDGGG
jgi:hypothetical protein